MCEQFCLILTLNRVRKVITVFQGNWNIENECFPSGASLPGRPGHLWEGHLPHLLIPVPLMHGQRQVGFFYSRSGAGGSPL